MSPARRSKGMSIVTLRQTNAKLQTPLVLVADGRYCNDNSLTPAKKPPWQKAHRAYTRADEAVLGHAHASKRMPFVSYPFRSRCIPSGSKEEVLGRKVCHCGFSRGPKESFSLARQGSMGRLVDGASSAQPYPSMKMGGNFFLKTIY